MEEAESGCGDDAEDEQAVDELSAVDLNEERGGIGQGDGRGERGRFEGRPVGIVEGRAEGGFGGGEVDPIGVEIETLAMEQDGDTGPIR